MFSSNREQPFIYLQYLTSATGNGEGCVFCPTSQILRPQSEGEFFLHAGRFLHYCLRDCPRINDASCARVCKWDVRVLVCVVFFWSSNSFVPRVQQKPAAPVNPEAELRPQHQVLR